MTNWNTSHTDPHIAAPGTLELTLRTHPSGNLVPAVWNDQGHDYDGEGARKTFRSRRRALRHGKKLLGAAGRSIGVNREVVDRTVVDTDVFERHVVSE